MGVAAFPDGAGHPALLGRAKGMAPERREHVQFQQKTALRKADVPGAECLNPHPLVGCQAVFLAPVDNGADASAERAGEKGDMGNREHDGAGPGKIVALHPEIGAGERGAAVLFRIPHTAVKAVQLPVYGDAAPKGMAHAENAVPALHGEKAEWPHDIPRKGRKGPIVDFAAYPGQFDVAAVAGKPAFVRPYDAVADREILYGKLACSFL